MSPGFVNEDFCRGVGPVDRAEGGEGRSRLGVDFVSLKLIGGRFRYPGLCAPKLSDAPDGAFGALDQVWDIRWARGSLEAGSVSSISPGSRREFYFAID